MSDIETARQRDLAKEREIEDEVKQCCNHIKWKRNKDPKDADTWFYDLRDIYTVSDKLSGEFRKQVLKWKAALGDDYLPYKCRKSRLMLETYHRMIDNALRSFKAPVVDLSLASWISRACAKHQYIHDRAQIPKLVSSY